MDPNRPPEAPYIPEIGPGAAKKSGGSSTWIIVVIVLGVVGLVGLFGVGVLAALAIYGTRRYVATAKSAEAKVGIGAFARGLGECYVARGTLPATSAPVPADLASVSGKKYQSAPAEWSDEAYACARFSLVDPQYYQYQWVRESDTTGYVRAVGDLDGDGIPGEFRLSLACSADGCTPAPSIDERDPTE